MDSFDMRSLRMARSELNFALIELREIQLRHRFRNDIRSYSKMPQSDVNFIGEQIDKIKVAVDNISNLIEGNEE